MATLERSLTLTDAVSIGIGAMISGGIFVLSGISANAVGSGAIVSFALGAILAGITALSFAELSASIPRAGGPYDFLKGAFGDFYGFLGGWTYFFGYTAACASYILAFGIYFSQYILKVPPLLVCPPVIVILLVLNILGTETSGKVGNILTFFKIGVLLLFAGIGIFFIEPDKVFSPVPGGWGRIFLATNLIFVTYLGFGLISTAAEEIDNPSKNIPKAILFSIGSVALIYILTMVVVVGVTLDEKLGEAALSQIGAKIMGTPGLFVLTAGALLATFSAANATIMTTSRIIYAISRDQHLPALFSTVNQKLRSPIPAIFGTMVIIGVLLLTEKIEFLATLAALSALIVFVLVNLSLIHLRFIKPNIARPFIAPLFPLLQIAGIILILVIIFSLPAPIWAVEIGVLVAGVLIFRAHHPIRSADVIKPWIIMWRESYESTNRWVRSRWRAAGKIIAKGIQRCKSLKPKKTRSDNHRK